MDADQGRGGMNVAHHNRDSLFLAAVLADVAFKTQNTEMPPPGGEIGFSEFAD